MNSPDKKSNETDLKFHEEDISLCSTLFTSKTWVRNKFLIPTLITIAGCTTPKISSASEIDKIPAPGYPELHIIAKRRPPVHLDIFTPGKSIDAASLPEYRAHAEKIISILEGRAEFLESHIAESDVSDCSKQLAMESGTFKNIETATLIVIEKIKNGRFGPSSFVARVKETIDLDLLPQTAKLLGDHNCRVYVVDGAYMQGEVGCLSIWALTAAKALESRLPGLSMNVSALRYAEKSSIRNSAKNMAVMIQEDLENNPLKEDEEILFLGHSQGAFILSYLAHAAEHKEEFAVDLPWDSVKRMINIDLPMNVTYDYSGKFETLVDPTLFLARNDIFVFPLLCEIFFPAGNDYLGNSDAYERVKEPSQKEYRLQRQMLDGSYVNPTVAGEYVDNPDCQFEHHPFLSYLGYKNREVRENVLKLIIGTLPVIAPTMTPESENTDLEKTELEDK